MAIDYDDLIVGEVYFGVVNKTHYFFTYLGEGKWSGGKSNLYPTKSTILYPPNTNKVKPIYRVNVFPLEGAWFAEEAALHNGFNLFGEIAKPIDKLKVVVEKVKYKVINCHSPVALFKVL